MTVEKDLECSFLDTRVLVLVTLEKGRVESTIPISESTDSNTSTVDGRLALLFLTLENDSNERKLLFLLLDKDESPVAGVKGE
jgi:hypothetical protein